MYTVSLVKNPGPEHSEYCANLYQRLRCEVNGKLNPYSRAYTSGGVHFIREAEWFEEQFSRPGARLACVQNEIGSYCGYALFFTDDGNFPPFADDCLQYRGIEGNDLGLAYTYLFAVEHLDRGLGLGWRLMELVRECALDDGCGLIAHEFFVRPRVNVASSAFHLKMEARWGAADTGRTATHFSTELGANIVYAQYLIPAGEKHKVVVNFDGSLRLE
jgi:GNAT superfamily N-acetyltransferase